MKILLIGAGYVGMALMQQWTDASFIATTTSIEKIDTLKSVCDEVHLLENEETLKQLINRCDAIVVAVAPKKGATYKETYLETAKTIVAACEKPSRLLYTSSTGVYGESDLEWVDETTECLPTTDNQQILLDTEQIYLNAPNLKATILRLGGIYGPERTLQNRCNYFSGKQVDNGEQVTNSIHLDDIVRAIPFCLKNELFGIYNLVSDDHPTRKELYTPLCEELQIPLPIWTSNNAVHKAKVSNRKIKNAGFKFTKKRSETII